MEPPKGHASKKGYPKGPDHHGYKAVRWTVVDTGYQTRCWIWKLARGRDGYGVVWDGRSMRVAHRVYWEEAHGPVPEGLTLDHLCRERGCVRPDHLEPVTHAENCRRGRRTKLTLQQVDEIRRSSATQSVLARRYGVSQSQVSRIKREKSWSTARLLVSTMRRCMEDANSGH